VKQFGGILLKTIRYNQKYQKIYGFLHENRIFI